MKRNFINALTRVAQCKVRVHGMPVLTSPCEPYLVPDLYHDGPEFAGPEYPALVILDISLSFPGSTNSAYGHREILR